MNEPRQHRHRLDGIASDLVEYIIVSVPDLDALDGLAPALAELVHDAAIRILDLVVVVKDRDGSFAPLELDVIEALATLRALDEDIGGMLSDRDIQLAASALPAGSTGVIVVTEDRWAEPLSSAARGVGGQIIAGDRIPAARVATVLAERGIDPHGPRSSDVT